MPIYEYGCDACGHVFEEWYQHADNIQEEPCPKCANTAHRLISNTSFVLKGGGWYVTEYGNRKPDAATSSASDTKSADTQKSVDAPAKNTESPSPAKTDATPAPAAS